MAAENPQNESPTSSYQFTVDVNENDYNLHLKAVNISTALEFLLVVKPEEVASVTSHLCFSIQELATLLNCAIVSKGGASLRVSKEEDTLLICTLIFETMVFTRKVTLNLIFQPPQDQVLTLIHRVAALTQELDRLKAIISAPASSSTVSECAKPILLLVNLTTHFNPSLSFPEIPSSIEPHIRISANIYTMHSGNANLSPTIAPHPVELIDGLHHTIIDLRYEPDGPRALYWGDPLNVNPSSHLQSTKPLFTRPMRQRTLWDNWIESRSDPSPWKSVPSVIGWFPFAGNQFGDPTKISIRVNSDHRLYESCKTSLDLLLPFVMNDFKNPPPASVTPSTRTTSPFSTVPPALVAEYFQSWDILFSLTSYLPSKEVSVPIICSKGNRIVFANPFPFGLKSGHSNEDILIPGSSDLMWKLMFELAASPFRNKFEIRKKSSTSYDR